MDKNIDSEIIRKVGEGYPHIDKPWLKFYSSSIPKTHIRENVYDGMKRRNKDNMDKPAISFYGNKITYGQLCENVDSASKLLTAFGVQKDDRIMTLMPNIPETSSLLYGAMQIGAVSDYVDPRGDSIDINVSANKILNLFVQEQSKHLIVLDQCYLTMIKPIENELKDLGIEKIIVVSPGTSMNLKSYVNYLLETSYYDGLKSLKHKLSLMKKMQSEMNESRIKSPIELLDYKTLLSDSRYVQFHSIGYIPNKLDVIEHTSGTSSSMPKPIPLSNDNINSYINQTFFANMNMSAGDKALHILPFFASFGTCGIALAGFAHGCELQEIPEFSPKNLGKMILRYKPQIIIGTPTWFVNLVNDPVLKNADLSFIKMVTYGGDSMNANDIIRVNNFLKEHNCNAVITTGHGLSETCGCASYATDEYNIPGTIGIPLPNTTYCIVDSETKTPKKFEPGCDTIEGEALISSETATIGILDDNIVANHVTIDGEDYLCTGDIIKMNKDGIMQFLLRGDRAFSRFDCFKVKPNEIEPVIKQYPGVKECVITPYFSEKYNGTSIYATISLNDGVELSPDEKIEFVKDLLDVCFIKNPNVSSRQIPTKFRFCSCIPMTKNDKVAYKSIINAGLIGDEITVDIDETNVTVSNISVYGPNPLNCKKYCKRK